MGNELNMDSIAMLGQIFKPDVVSILRQKLSGDTAPAVIVDTVQPGDLITADLMNQVLLVLADLQRRVSALESSGTTTKRTQINDLIPSGSRRVGDILHIIGEGFSAPGGNKVLIDSIQVVPSFGVDGDKELIVTIPNLSVSSVGRTVTVLVSNLNGTDTMDFNVLPGLPTLPAGQLFVSLVAGPSGEVKAGDRYTFEYRVRAMVNLAERYTLQGTTDAGWKTEIVNSSGNLITDPKLEIPSAPPPDGTTAQVFVRVTVPDVPDSTSTKLRLSVKSVQNSALTGTSAGEELKVGAAAPSPEPIAVQFEEVAATDPNSQPLPSYQGGVVKIPGGAGKYRLALNAKGCTPNVPYTRVIAPISDSKWSASFLRTTSRMSESFTPQDGTMQTFYLFISAQSGAPAAELVVQIAADADASDKGHISQPITVL
jgi:hypothetical protein